MGGSCSHINKHLVFLPEVEEEKKHGKTKTVLNNSGQIRVYNKRDRRNSAPVTLNEKNSVLDRELRRRYTQHYQENIDIINKSLMFK